MKYLKALLLILFLLNVEESFSVVGCKIGNQVYTNQYTGINATVVLALVTYGNFHNSPTLSALSNDCPRAGNITPVPGLINLCVVDGSLLTFGIGSMVNYDELQPPLGCNLDDYSWALGATAAGLGFIFIRRRKNSSN